jgi:hypothetical protein
MGDADSVQCPAQGGDLIAPAAPPAEEAVEPANLDAGLAAAIVRVRAISATLAAFAEAGCTVTDQLLACVVTIPGGDAEGVPHRELIDTVTDVADIHLRFSRPPVSFELTAAAGAALDFMAEPAGDATSAFDGEELARAERAWQGDVAAAQSLRGEWSGDLTVSLAAPLNAYDRERAWRAIRTSDVIADSITTYPWWRSGELIHDGSRGVIVAVTNESPVQVQTPSLAVVSLDQFEGTGPVVPGVNARRAAVRSATTTQLPVDLPLPEELEPGPNSIGGAAVIEGLRPRCEATAWAWLSNAVELGEDEPGGYATLEFFGYRRRTFRVGAPGYTAAPGQRAYQMYTTATQEPSPDRVLAIRQVVSLHDGPDLPAQPNDIARAAEPLYQALRAGEVAAVLETQRQARSIAVDAARSAADAAQTGAKSAAERTIASLAAVAGIAVANATAVLSKADARAIAVGIAILFVFLAAWAIFVEGPTMRAPLKSFASDLPTVGYLLPEADRAAVLGMDALKTAANAVLRVRILAPFVYATGCTLTLVIAHSRFGLRL